MSSTPLRVRCARCRAVAGNLFGLVSAASGWSWAFFMCQTTLSYNMVKVAAKFRSSDLATARKQLVAPNRRLPTLGKKRLVLCPYVDKAYSLCWDEAHARGLHRLIVEKFESQDFEHERPPQ